MDLRAGTYGGTVIPQDCDGVAAVQPMSKRARRLIFGSAWYVVRLRDGRVLASGDAFEAAKVANRINNA